MTSPPTRSPPPTDPAARAAVALTRAEERRAMLEHMADWGMMLSKDICTRSIENPYHPELRHDPGRSFASASRAVRLTLAMEERVEAYILALCNGVTPTATRMAFGAAVGRDAVSAREGVAKSVAGSADEHDGDEEADDLAEPAEAREREWEALVDFEDFDARLTQDCNACIGAVRKDLERVSSSLPVPPLYGEGRLAEGERGGEVGVKRETRGDPHFPTPDFASLRLDPPHKGEGLRGAYHASG